MCQDFALEDAEHLYIITNICLMLMYGQLSYVHEVRQL